ncbi:hypothetical protein MVI01_42820 [Myxococcus virescens]|uniref:Uncharacterized protein n=1 Tax=Myxococcus virescens TaxID=83456 RepID=A0A511HG42_9BACT|nr:hypothetical protein MVI01_42820 [Myxococcus virescens]SDE40202.1 hypothetical protein SAMN04488504_106367 [Myxococcus virescens]
MKHGYREGCLLLMALGIACSSGRSHYTHEEVPKLGGEDAFPVAPGPWPQVPAVFSDSANVPDDLVIPTLTALMALPGSAGACDASTGRPRPDAAEYCVALYRTPEDWRVSWPLRNVANASGTCQPPWGGVDDADFGRELPIFGYAHNHPCGSGISSQDLSVWPLAKSGEGVWIMVAYGTTPSGKLARDSRGQLIPAWGWLATGQRDAPLFYKWNQQGQVYQWDEGGKHWRFHANCQPGRPSTFRPQGVPPDCTPALRQ